jgi:hypothetical protein
VKSKRTLVALALGLLASVSACSGNTLSETRDRPTATLLPDGDVLVAGGAQYKQFLWTGGTKALTSADRYDAESGTWTPAGSMALGRYEHTATVLPSGKVLVAGGITRSAEDGTTQGTSTAELYDPESGTWSRTGPMTQERTGHQATLLADGRVLVTGGSTEYIPRATAEVYDPGTGSWFPLASMGTVRSGHSATLLPDGTVLVSGGFDSVHITAATAEVYDPVSNTWSPTGNMHMPRAGHVSTPLPNGKVLVTGSNGRPARAELYEPATGTWTAAGTRAESFREKHTATSLPDGRVLVAGGYGGTNSQLSVLETTEVYVPETDSWTSSSPLPEPRTGHSAVLLGNGRVLVVGGSTPKNAGAYTPLDTSVTFDPGTNTWK